MKTVLSKMQSYLWVTIVIVGLVGSVGCNVCFAAESFPTLVTTTLGQLQGFYSSEGAVAWHSVPFAKPPIGDLRWRAPQPPDAWDGVRDATSMCEPCTQKGNVIVDDYIETIELAGEEINEATVFGSEDCLYLNIFRPKTAARNLPVYVFIHGGVNIGGNIAGFDGSMLAEKGNMIVVFVQFRVGPLGYFSHPVLRSGRSLTDDSGSYGILDNIQALKWIQKNISAFGGNPQNVTIAGESSGGQNVMFLLISPMAKGLFHRAVAESPALLPLPRKNAESLSNHIITLLLEKDGYTREDWDSWDKAGKQDYLKTASDADLVEICYDNVPSLISPVISRGVIPGNILDRLRTGHYNKVPVILGTNRNEFKVLMIGPMGEPIFRIQSWAELPQILTGEKSMDDAFSNPFEKELFETIGEYSSRFWRFQAVDDRARVMKEHQDSIYAYRFDWCGPEPFNILGAAHATEIPFFFGMHRGPFNEWTPEADTSGRKELSDIIMTYLANFAATGNPNGGTVPVWQEWSNDADGPKVVLLDADEDQATIEMSYEELYIQDIRAELRDKISQWRPMKRIQYGFYPYLCPMIFQQMQPEQIAIDLGFFGEYTWNTGRLLRNIMYSDMFFNMMKAQQP